MRCQVFSVWTSNGTPYLDNRFESPTITLSTTLRQIRPWKSHHVARGLLPFSTPRDRILLLYIYIYIYICMYVCLDKQIYVRTEGVVFWQIIIKNHQKKSNNENQPRTRGTVWGWGLNDLDSLIGWREALLLNWMDQQLLKG